MLFIWSYKDNLQQPIVSLLVQLMSETEDVKLQKNTLFYLSPLEDKLIISK